MIDYLAFLAGALLALWLITALLWAAASWLSDRLFG